MAVGQQRHHQQFETLLFAHNYTGHVGDNLFAQPEIQADTSVCKDFLRFAVLAMNKEN